MIIVRPTFTGPVYTVEITDDFNRTDRHLTADGYIRVTDGLVSSNQMNIVSGTVRRGGTSTGSDGTDVYLHPTPLSGPAQWAEALFSKGGSDIEAGQYLVLRCTGTTQDSDTAVYAGVTQGDGWFITIATIGDGTDASTSPLASGSFTRTPADAVMRVEITDDDTVTLFWDGMQIGTYTGALPTGTRAGFSPSTLNNSAWLDDYQAGTF